MQVVYRLEALADLSGHFRYIAREDPRAAAKAAAEIRRAIGRLALFPRSGRKGAVPGTFELVIPRLPHIAVYRIHSAVEILAVFHRLTDEPRA